MSDSYCSGHTQCPNQTQISGSFKRHKHWPKHASHVYCTAGQGSKEISPLGACKHIMCIDLFCEEVIFAITLERKKFHAGLNVSSFQNFPIFQISDFMRGSGFFVCFFVCVCFILFCFVLFFVFCFIFS